MSKPPEDGSLEFLARQWERLLIRLGAIEDQITALTGMAIRHDGALALRPNSAVWRGR
jgi:hypothetical protein